MNANSRKRWLLPLAASLCGLVAGTLLTALRPPEPAPAARREAGTGNLSISKPLIAIPAGHVIDNLWAAKDLTLAERVKLEQAALELTPEEALRRTRTYDNAFIAPDSLKSFAVQLLWYRAAGENPEQALEEAGKLQSSGARVAVPGIFRAWVEKNPAAALHAAAGNESRSSAVLDACIAAWAECDPAACAVALQGKTMTEKSIVALLRGWTARDPAAALTWSQKQAATGVMRTAYEQWACAAPLVAFQAACSLATHNALADDSQRANLRSCALAALHPFMNRLPELAVEAACRELPRFVDQDDPGNLGYVANNLEGSMRGGGKQFALALPPGVAQLDAMGWVASIAVARVGVSEAIELFNLPAVPQNPWPAMRETLVTIALRDPESGREWLLDMRPRLGPGKFLEAARYFNEHVIRVAPAMTIDPGDVKDGS